MKRHGNQPAAGSGLRRLTLLGLGLALGAALAGCGRREITEYDRKQARHHAAEANFAASVRDWARAEGLFVRATELAPDHGGYWTNLGSMRMRLGNKSGAREAYERALKVHQQEAADDALKREVGPWLNQVYVLALLGRTGDARAVLEKAATKFPLDREVRSFVEQKQLDRMLADPAFKQVAL